MKERRFVHVAGMLVLVGLLIGLATPGLLQAQNDDERCFPETGFCISGTIRDYWEQNGGLSVFGYPLGEQHEEMIEGNPYQVQLFERNRLEIHPENEGTPYHVLLGRLGAVPVDNAAEQGTWTAPAPEEPNDTCVRFETGWNVCGNILNTFLASGLEMSDGTAGLSIDDSVALFGLPVTPAVTMEIEGQQYTVQWFERARFELHPENDPPYNVLLGRLGYETDQGINQSPTLTVAEGTTPPPAETPEPAETPATTETPETTETPATEPTAPAGTPVPEVPTTPPDTTDQPNDIAGTYTGTFTSDDAVQGGTYSANITIARNGQSASMNIYGENVSGAESYYYTGIASVIVPDPNTVTLISKDADGNEITATLTREGDRLHGSWSYSGGDNPATGTIDVTRSEG